MVERMSFPCYNVDHSLVKIFVVYKKRKSTMSVYTFLTVPVGIAAGILIALLTKRPAHLRYSVLDKVSRITNILLIPVYACLIPLTMVLGMFSTPYRDGFLGVLGWILSIVISSAALSCGLGLGASVALRKKGKSKAGFLIQFAGAVGIVLSFLLYSLFVGTLIAPLN